MPASATCNQASADSGHGMMAAVADRLAPLFTSDTIDPPFARQIALAAFEDYRPEAGIDFVNIARVLAFSMAAIDLLRQAGGKDLPLRDKMRLFGRANALNRSADQSERMMMQRRKHHRLQAAAARATRPTEPALDQAAIDAAVAEAMAVHDELQARTPPPAPAPEPAINRDPPPPPPAPPAKPAVDRGPPSRTPAVHRAGIWPPNVPPHPNAPLTTKQVRAAAMGSAAYIPVSLLAGVGQAPDPHPPRP